MFFIFYDFFQYEAKPDDEPMASNVFVLNDVNEKPMDIVESYLELLKDCKDDGEKLELLKGLFNDAGNWGMKEGLISMGYNVIEQLKDMTRNNENE